MSRNVATCILLAALLSGCQRKHYVLDPALKYRVARPTEVPVLITDPDTGRRVVYNVTFPANSFIVFPDTYRPE